MKLEPWAGPELWSKTITLRPCRARLWAVQTPITPAPITTSSTSSLATVERSRALRGASPRRLACRRPRSRFILQKSWSLSQQVKEGISAVSVGLKPQLLLRRCKLRSCPCNPFGSNLLRCLLLFAGKQQYFHLGQTATELDSCSREMQTAAAAPVPQVPPRVGLSARLGHGLHWSSEQWLCEHFAHNDSEGERISAAASSTALCTSRTHQESQAMKIPMPVMIGA